MAKRIDVNELDTAKTGFRDIPVTGDVDDAVDSPVELAPAAALGDFAAELAFMEEPVEVMVHESTDPFEAQVIELHCNGVPQFLIRGAPKVIKRKFLDILCTRQETVSTNNRAFGEDVNRVTRHSAVRFPFTVERDDNPRGAKWLRQRLGT